MLYLSDIFKKLQCWRGSVRKTGKKSGILFSQLRACYSAKQTCKNEWYAVCTGTHTDCRTKKPLGSRLLAWQIHAQNADNISTCSLSVSATSQKVPVSFLLANSCGHYSTWLDSSSFTCGLMMMCHFSHFVYSHPYYIHECVPPQGIVCHGTMVEATGQILSLETPRTLAGFMMEKKKPIQTNFNTDLIKILCYSVDA